MLPVDFLTLRACLHSLWGRTWSSVFILRLERKTGRFFILVLEHSIHTSLPKLDDMLSKSHWLRSLCWVRLSSWVRRRACLPKQGGLPPLTRISCSQPPRQCVLAFLCPPRAGSSCRDSEHAPTTQLSTLVCPVTKNLPAPAPGLTFLGEQGQGKDGAGMCPNEHLGFQQWPGKHPGMVQCPEKLAAGGPRAALGGFCAAKLPPSSALSLRGDRGPTSVL